MNERDAFEEFQRALEKMKGTVRVLETSMPVEKQMEFFRYSETVRTHSENETIDGQIEILASNAATSEERKYAMTFLANSGEVKAFRALENYKIKEKLSEEETLNDWVSMCLVQSQMMLESELSDEKQVFISTGLGGRGNMFRFYAFFKSEGLKKFSDYQRNLIEKEFPFHICKYEGEVESINIESNYFSLLFLMNLEINLKNVLLNAVAECNECGNFISSTFIVTNVKTFSVDEIQKELLKK